MAGSFYLVSLQAYKTTIRHCTFYDLCLCCHKIGVPFMNGAPNLTCDIPALIELAKQTAHRSAAKISKRVKR
jgi:hypothetical protein